MLVKYTFKNIGPVKDAELSLGDLTVIAGANNSGKTYLAYALYGFLQFIEGVIPQVKDKKRIEEFYYFNHFVIGVIEDKKDKINLKEQGGSYALMINGDHLLSMMRSCLSNLSRYFSAERVASFFSAKEHRFVESSMACEFELDDDDGDVMGQHFSMIGKYSYDASTDTVEITLNEYWSGYLSEIEKEEEQSPHEVCANLVLIAFLNGYFFNSPFILSSERFGISLFFKELDFTKNRLVERLQDLRDKNKKADEIYPDFLDRHSSRYARPIKDNIDFTRELEEVQRRRSALIESKLFDNIKGMMEAYYRYSNYEINFISKKQKGFKIPLHLASSSARGLSDLYFYLRHVAKEGQLLIIDEPESHLSPENQIEMARLLVRCVNAGIKILITTHSDYMIKEFNNLIMLSSDFEGKADFLRRHKKDYGHEDYLEQQRIKGYLCQKGTLVSCEVNEYGIQMDNFDKAIEKMNDISNTLGFMLEGKK